MLSVITEFYVVFFYFTVGCTFLCCTIHSQEHDFINPKIGPFSESEIVVGDKCVIN